MAQNGKLRIIANYTGDDIAGPYVNPMDIKLEEYYGLYRPPAKDTAESRADADAATIVQPDGEVADLNRFETADINNNYLDTILAIPANSSKFKKQKLIVVRLELTKNEGKYDTVSDDNRIYITNNSSEQVYKKVDDVTISSDESKQYYSIKIVGNKLTIHDADGNKIPITSATTLGKLLSKLLGTEITIATSDKSDDDVTQPLITRGGKKSKKHRKKGGKKSQKRRSMRRLKRSRARK